MAASLSCWPALGNLGSLGLLCVGSVAPEAAALQELTFNVPSYPCVQDTFGSDNPKHGKRHVSVSKGLGMQSSSPALATDSKDTEPLQASVYSLVNQRG